MTSSCMLGATRGGVMRGVPNYPSIYICWFFPAAAAERLLSSPQHEEL